MGASGGRAEARAGGREVRQMSWDMIGSFLSRVTGSDIGPSDEFPKRIYDGLYITIIDAPCLAAVTGDNGGLSRAGSTGRRVESLRNRQGFRQMPQNLTFA